MKVWITKYALTRGLFEIEARIVDGQGVKYASADRLFTREYALTRDEAIELAEDMRVRKIASLNKAVKKLTALNFKTGNTGKKS